MCTALVNLKASKMNKTTSRKIMRNSKVIGNQGMTGGGMVINLKIALRISIMIKRVIRIRIKEERRASLEETAHRKVNQNPDSAII